MESQKRSEHGRNKHQRGEIHVFSILVEKAAAADFSGAKLCQLTGLKKIRN